MLVTLAVLLHARCFKVARAALAITSKVLDDETASTVGRHSHSTRLQPVHSDITRGTIAPASTIAAAESPTA